MRALTFLALLLLLPVTVLAAHGLIFPSADLVNSGETPLTLQIRVFDPVEHRSPELARPQRFQVQHLGEQTDLLATLKPAQEQTVTAWMAALPLKSAGDYTFSSESPPSWQAADGQFVVYLSKLCVNVLGREEGWDEPVGLEAEIVPLSRPYGLWTGNLFSAQLLLNGEPLPDAEIRVAYLGDAPDSPAPGAAWSNPYRVQKVRTAADGVFHYAMPRAGWWGFAATLEADWTIRKDGAETPVSLVTSYWVQTRDLK